MEMDIEIKASPEALDEGHRTCSGPDFLVSPAFLIRNVERVLLTRLRTSPMIFGSLANRNLS